MIPHGYSSITEVINKDSDDDNEITVACYYFGNYHLGDSRNRVEKGEAWSEWELVKAARPRFPGHHQPNVPTWGYEDESDPTAMARKIEAASEAGIDAFIFDWYWYDDGPFLDRPLDLGFLGADNVEKLKFSLMWANHDWIDIHPYTKGTPYKILYPGQVSRSTFETLTDHVIKNYFAHPSYWKINNLPYFSFYDLSNLLASAGTVEEARLWLDGFREKACEAGLEGLHLNAVVWGQPVLPVEKTPASTQELVKQLGFDSVTSYVWIHHVPLDQKVTDYNDVRDRYLQYWESAEELYAIPYYPNVTMGWDSSPRANQNDLFDNSGYPFTNTIGNNTPENFAKALGISKERLQLRPRSERILNINCWNEWTEGSYLEPDTRYGMRYLDAVKSIKRDP